MTDMTKIPVSIITGFLGSGKTTLISQLMQNPQGKRLAVIVNEFGDVGVDGEILKNCAIPECPAENIMELANGCICCTVADDFIPTIEALMALDPQPDHILIETSGLALPKPLLKAFDWPDIRSRITVDGVIAKIGPFFSWAVREGWSLKNPVKGILRPKKDDSPPSIFTPDEVQRLFKLARKTDPGMIPYLALGLFAGVRPMEIERLSWNNILNGFIEITADKAKNRQIIDSSKSLTFTSE